MLRVAGPIVNQCNPFFPFKMDEFLLSPVFTHSPVLLLSPPLSYPSISPFVEVFRTRTESKHPSLALQPAPWSGPPHLSPASLQLSPNWFLVSYSDVPVGFLQWCSYLLMISTPLPKTGSSKGQGSWLFGYSHWGSSSPKKSVWNTVGAQLIFVKWIYALS